MISIVMPYRDRPVQLYNTLLSLKSAHKFNVIIVDDASTDLPVVPLGLGYECHVIKITEKQWNNPEPVYNIGILQALKYGADIIIMQNPECLHAGPVIDHAALNCNDNNYLTYGCFSLSRESTKQKRYNTNYIGASFDGQDAWYNHSIYRPVAYEFCAAITANNIRKLNGYDERLMHGWGSGDRYFLYRVRLMGLSVEIVDKPFVFHQWHYSAAAEYNNPENIEKNIQLYNELVKEEKYKAVHLVTPDL